VQVLGHLDGDGLLQVLLEEGDGRVDVSVLALEEDDVSLLGEGDAHADGIAVVLEVVPDSGVVLAGKGPLAGSLAGLLINKKTQKKKEKKKKQET